MLRKSVVIVIAAVAFWAAGDLRAQMRAGQVDLFMGLDFNYRDIYHNGRIMDVLVELTPGVKWNMGRRWELAAQVKIPVINQFGSQYKYVTLNQAVVSKQALFGKRLRMKFSAGKFSYDRYGLDVKAMYAANSWLAISGNAGLTGYLTISGGWGMSPMKRVTFAGGPEFWLARWATQFKLRGGRFVYGDYGVIAEAIRHFRHVSVGIFGAYSTVGKENAGFKIIVMIPPYKKWTRKVNFRPASNFRLTYSNNADPYANGEYATDPEQNERTGWFDPDIAPWGPDTMPRL